MGQLTLTESQLSYLLSIAKDHKVDPTEPDHLIDCIHLDQVGSHSGGGKLTKALKADLFHQLNMLDSHDGAMLALTLNSIVAVQERYEGGWPRPPGVSGSPRFQITGTGRRTNCSSPSAGWLEHPGALASAASLQRRRKERHMNHDHPTEKQYINLPIHDDPLLHPLLQLVRDPASAELNALARDCLGLFLHHREFSMAYAPFGDRQLTALLDAVKDQEIDLYSPSSFLDRVSAALAGGLEEKWHLDEEMPGSTETWAEHMWRELTTNHPWDFSALVLTLRAAWAVSDQYEGGAVEALRVLGLDPGVTPTVP